jgi:peptidoglycan/xylan/chitin deacetylase (PgdA/CDA1 family)
MKRRIEAIPTCAGGRRTPHRETSAKVVIALPPRACAHQGDGIMSPFMQHPARRYEHPPDSTWWERWNGIKRLAMTAALILSATSSWAAQTRPLVVTVDDLPVAGGSLHTDPHEREKITRDLLDVLARHHIQAVGLVIWGAVDSDSDRKILQMWLDAGHELGNHSATHPSYTSTSQEEYIADVEAGRAGLAAFLAPHGAGVRYFRFPMLREGETGAKLEAMRDYLAASGQRNLHVTIDDQDWSFERPWVEARRQNDTVAMERISSEYLESLRLSVRHHERTGDKLEGRVTPQILLLHANEVGAANWDALFTWLAATGHRFAPAGEVMTDAVFAARRPTWALTAPATGIACWPSAAAKRPGRPPATC